MSRCGLPLLLFFLLNPFCAFPAEEADRLIRNTEARSAEEQRKGFQLPQGFSIQLFADETQLGGKPINMAFDARGRLWVSSTREYPFAVPKTRWSDPQGTRAKDSPDTIRILEDTDGDGRADKVTIFADELNIPTGVLPYKNGCIAWSIPNLWFLEDMDGDGICDKRRILFGPLGYERDTHGMVSSLRLGLDGWVYATHGFSNTSHFEVRPENRARNDEVRMTNDEKGKSESAAGKSEVSSFGIRHSDFGQSLDITSGSVFRFKPDGSRVELWTNGQVNPFGLCWDSWGNLYSADCHSNPITQLIRGATYPQFGKTTDPLGFGPVMCEHAHGSTGLCGIIYIDGDVWGPEWNDHMLVGNCVTSRVNHDHITFTGATPRANEAPDFLTSDDPWFRPVDLQLGPDSALYIADFYNKIIGHYEVPLDHPGRDRERGRIWRVVREGFTGTLTECDLSKRDVKELVEAMGDRNLTKRSLAVELAVEQGLKLNWSLPQARDPLGPPEAASLRRAYAMYAAVRSHPKHLYWVSILAESSLEWAHLMNLHDSWSVNFDFAKASLMGTLPRGLYHPRACLAAVRAMGGDTRNKLAGVMAFYENAYARPDDGYKLRRFDATLVHTARIALKRQLEHPTGYDQPGVDLSNRETGLLIVDASLAVPTAASASWLLARLVDPGLIDPELRHIRIPESRFPEIITHIARHLPASREGELVALAQKHFADDLDAQLDLLAAIREGRSLALQNRNASQAPASSAPRTDSTSESLATGPLAAWSAELTVRLLAELQSDPPDTWHSVTPPTLENPNPWHPRVRKCGDGKERNFFDSHVAPGSEKLRGTLRSAPFALPAKLTFWIAGHRGFPTAAPTDLTYVRLVDAVTGEELARAYPPRNDVAQEVTWTFDQAENGTRAHQQTFLELTDNDTATAYAWLAAGGFDPAVVSIPTDPLRRDKRIRHLAELCPPGSANDRKDAGPAGAFLSNLPHKPGFTPETRYALAKFLASISPDPSAPLLVALSRDEELASTAFALLQPPNSVSDSLVQAFRTLPFRSQTRLATALAGSVKSANRLLAIAPPAVLAEPLVSSTLNALDDGKVSQRLKALTASLPPQNAALQKLVAQRLKSFDPVQADLTRGELVFTTMCSICHRIGVRGNLVGPQLDGIGVRGIERLLEDILDPNRLVDPAFRLHMVKRRDGSLYAGLLRREEGDKVIFADAMAQETAIAKADISADEESPFSLMPPGLGEALTEQQLHDLLAYLLARK